MASYKNILKVLMKLQSRLYYPRAYVSEGVWRKHNENKKSSEQPLITLGYKFCLWLKKRKVKLIKTSHMIVSELVKK